MQIIAQPYPFGKGVLSPLPTVVIVATDQHGWLDRQSWEAMRRACQQRREVLLRTADGALYRWHQLLFLDASERTAARYLRVVPCANKAVR